MEKPFCVKVFGFAAQPAERMTASKSREAVRVLNMRFIKYSFREMNFKIL
jgi:hypothetical protein